MIGLLFGSFDPPHIGHYLLAKAALSVCDSVFMIPAYQNPFKNKSTDYNIRCNMLDTMLDDYEAGDKIQTCYVEGVYHRRYGHSYTYEILQYFQNLNTGEDYAMIVTPETLNEIPTWKEGNWILNNCNFITTFRYDHTSMPKQFVNVNLLDDIKVHSSNIRASINKGENPFPYITDGVYNIIKIEKLYNDKF